MWHLIFYLFQENIFMWEQLRCPRRWSYKWEVKKKEKKQNRADIFIHGCRYMDCKIIFLHPLTLQPAEPPGRLKKQNKKHITTQKPGGTRHHLVTRTEKMWVRETCVLKKINPETYGDLCPHFVYLFIQTLWSGGLLATGRAAGLDLSLKQHLRVHG